MRVVPQLRINVFHVPAERFAVQLPPQRQAVCDATESKHTGIQRRERKSRDDKMMERGEENVTEKDVREELPADLYAETQLT